MSANQKLPTRQRGARSADFPEDLGDTGDDPYAVQVPYAVMQNVEGSDDPYTVEDPYRVGGSAGLKHGFSQNSDVGSTVSAPPTITSVSGTPSKGAVLPLKLRFFV